MQRFKGRVVGRGGRAANLLIQHADQVVAHVRVWERNAPCPELSGHAADAHIASLHMHILVRIGVRAPSRIATGWPPSSGSPSYEPSPVPARPSGHESSSDRGPRCSSEFKI